MPPTRYGVNSTWPNSAPSPSECYHLVFGCSQGRFGSLSCREAVNVWLRAEVKFLRAARQRPIFAGTAKNFRSWA